MERRTRRPARAPENVKDEGGNAERRDEKQDAAQRNGRLLILALLLGIAALTVILVILITSQRSSAPVSQPEATPTATTYDAATPFGPSDLSAGQMQRLMQEGSFQLTAGEVGPRGISIGDSLDALLSRLPIQVTEDMSNDMAVLYSASSGTEGAADVLLPPYGMLTVKSDMLEITLVAPLTSYPDDVGACYVKYPNVWCRYTINPEDNNVSQITLGSGCGSAGCRRYVAHVRATSAGGSPAPHR